MLSEFLTHCFHSVLHQLDLKLSKIISFLNFFENILYTPNFVFCSCGTNFQGGVGGSGTEATCPPYSFEAPGTHAPGLCSQPPPLPACARRRRPLPNPQPIPHNAAARGPHHLFGMRRCARRTWCSVSCSRTSAAHVGRDLRAECRTDALKAVLRAGPDAAASPEPRSDAQTPASPPQMWGRLHRMHGLRPVHCPLGGAVPDSKKSE